MNIKQRLRNNALDPRDPDHDDLDDLHHLFAGRYVAEYAEHGTMGGVDMTDLELADDVVKAKANMIHLNAHDDHQKSCNDYTRALIGEVLETAWAQVEEDWRDLLNSHQREIEEQAYDI